MTIYIIGCLFLLLLLSYSILPTYAYRLRHFMGKAYNPSTNNIYLTFDDGPDPLHTNDILDLLEEYKVKASFFIVTTFAEQYPHLIQRMKQDGHFIGLHSYEHKDGLSMPPAFVKQDFYKSNLILKKLGIKTTYYRPPWGHFNLVIMMQMKKYALMPIMWDVMAQDWKGHITAKEIAKRLEIKTQAGDIICLHDGRGENDAPQRTLEALKIALPILLNKGLKFDTVENYGK